MKKPPGDIIILNRCNINDNHMMYGSWDTKHNRKNFLSFWTTFCPFTPPNNPKNETFWKNEKKNPPTDIIILHKCTINDSHMMYGSWNMECNNIIFCHFGQFFALLLPKPKKPKFWKKNMEKLPRDIIILHRCNINDNHMMYGSYDMKCDGQYFLSFWTVFCSFHPSNNLDN